MTDGFGRISAAIGAAVLATPTVAQAHWPAGASAWHGLEHALTSPVGLGLALGAGAWLAVRVARRRRVHRA